MLGHLPPRHGRLRGFMRLERSECAAAIGEMVLSVARWLQRSQRPCLPRHITSITAAGKAAMESAVSTMKSVAKNAAKQFAGLAASQIKAKAAQQLGGLNLPPGVADKLADMQATPDSFDYVGFLKGLDPNGIVKVVDAFNKKICQLIISS